MGILSWFIASFIAWPIVVLVWLHAVKPFIVWSILSIGKKGFAPLFINLASSMIWMVIGIFAANVLSFIAKINPGDSVVLGIKVSELSVIIPIELIVPLIIGALTLNALANKWSK